MSSSSNVLFIFVGTVTELRLTLIPAIERKAKAETQVVRCPICYAICESTFEQRCILREGCCTECFESPREIVPVRPMFVERIPWPQQ